MDYLFREEDFLDPFAVQKRLFDDNADVDKSSMKLLVSGKLAKATTTKTKTSALTSYATTRRYIDR